MARYILHVCEGDKVVADAGLIDVSETSAAVAAAVLMAKELAGERRFLLATIVVTDEANDIVGRVPVWNAARAYLSDETELPRADA